MGGREEYVPSCFMLSKGHDAEYMECIGVLGNGRKLGLSEPPRNRFRLPSETYIAPSPRIVLPPEISSRSAKGRLLTVAGKVLSG